MALLTPINLQAACLLMGKELPFLGITDKYGKRGEQTLIVSGVRWYPDEFQLITSVKLKDQSVRDAISTGTVGNAYIFLHETGLNVRQACQLVEQGVIKPPSDDNRRKHAGVTVPLYGR